MRARTFAAVGFSSCLIVLLWKQSHHVVSDAAIEAAGGEAGVFLGPHPSGHWLEPMWLQPVQELHLLRLSGPVSRHFRSEECGADSQLSKARWAGFDEADKKVLNWMELAEAPPLAASLACLVYSYHKNRQHLRDTFAVWGQDCDVFLPFSDELWEDPVGGFRTIEVHPPNTTEDYKEIIAKTRAAFKEVGRRLDNGMLTFDFLVVSADDAFWIVPNLRSYLHDLPRMGAGVYLGHRMAVEGNPKEVYAAGAGYVINRPALQAYLACSLPDERHGFEEDVVMSQCLARAGIPAIPTEDVRGGRRFHFAGPSSMLALNFSSLADPTARWVRTFHKPWLSAMITGLPGIAKLSVLFHAVSGQRRYDMHDWFYRKRQCNTSGYT